MNGSLVMVVRDHEELFIMMLNCFFFDQRGLKWIPPPFIFEFWNWFSQTMFRATDSLKKS